MKEIFKWTFRLMFLGFTAQGIYYLLQLKLSIDYYSKTVKAKESTTTTNSFKLRSIVKSKSEVDEKSAARDLASR